MTNFFLQIRKRTDAGTMIREMSKSIARLQSQSISDADSIRKMRVNTDKIKHTGDSTNGDGYLESADLSKQDSDNVDHGDTDSNTLGTKGSGWTVTALDDGSDQTNPFQVNFAEVI